MDYKNHIHREDILLNLNSLLSMITYQESFLY